MEKCPLPAQEDQRVRLTKSLLQTAFLSLLEEKPVQNVTVKELCQRAGINRGTFYLHYRDVYDLLEQMEAALLAELDGILDGNPVIVPGTPHQQATVFTRAIFEFVEKNGELCAILLGEHGDKKFVNALIERAREKSVSEYCQLYPAVGRPQAELFYTFIAWGFIGLLQRSLRGPQPWTFQEMAEGAQRILAAASGFFQPE